MEAQQSPAPTETRSATEFAFRSPKSAEWKLLTGDSANDDVKRAAEKARENLEQLLLSSLKMEHLVVLAGSGCSLSVGGPSMGDLWNSVVGVPATENATSVAATTNYRLENDNIEAFLSHIDAWLSVANDADVTTFLKKAKKTILDKCSGFLEGASLSGHETLLHRLSRRRSRDQRLKLFTTNYDLCFEKAAGNIGGVAIDGFSFMAPRRYDPRYASFEQFATSIPDLKSLTPPERLWNVIHSNQGSE